MVYELSIVAHASLTEEKASSIKEMVAQVVGQAGGEILITDDWGKMNMAQMSTDGKIQGHYLYFMFKSNGDSNSELIRRFRINEHVLRHMIIKLADDSEAEKMKKKYKTPFSKLHGGSLVDDLDDDDEEKGDKRKFARSRNCWFASNGITADWKDPKTYAWLVNEFGKITPARITGLSQKHQRHSTSAIKRARNMGLISHLSNQVAYK